jgi:hypothetical protein
MIKQQQMINLIILLLLLGFTSSRRVVQRISGGLEIVMEVNLLLGDF